MVKNFAINDICAKPVKGNAAFAYRGFEISMSTVLAESHCVFVYSEGDEFYATFDTVEQAIEAVDSLLEKSINLETLADILRKSVRENTTEFYSWKTMRDMVDNLDDQLFASKKIDSRGDYNVSIGFERYR